MWIWLMGWVPGVIIGALVVIYHYEEVRFQFCKRYFTFNLLKPTPRPGSKFRFVHYEDKSLTFSYWHAFQLFLRSGRVWEVIVQWKKRDRTFD